MTAVCAAARADLTSVDAQIPERRIQAVHGAVVDAFHIIAKNRVGAAGPELEPLAGELDQGAVAGVEAALHVGAVGAFGHAGAEFGGHLVARPALEKQFGYKNLYQVPQIEKVVLNIGLGEAIKTPKLLEQAFECLGNITGQRPVVTRAKNSIATFKLREGMKIGCMVTLRRERMWEFLERLLSIALPRTRDFRGVSRKAFDGRGNYTLGIREVLIFPEVDIEKLDKVPGMNICIHTSANTDDEGRALLEQLGMPFRRV